MEAIAFNCLEHNRINQVDEFICYYCLKQILFCGASKIIQKARLSISIRKCLHTQRICIDFLCKEEDFRVGVDCEHPRTKEELGGIINQFKKAYERFKRDAGN